MDVSVHELWVLQNGQPNQNLLTILVALKVMSFIIQLRCKFSHPLIMRLLWWGPHLHKGLLGHYFIITVVILVLMMVSVNIDDV